MSPPVEDPSNQGFRRRLQRLFTGHGLYDADDDPFGEQRAGVKAPIRRPFTT